MESKGPRTFGPWLNCCIIGVVKIYVRFRSCFVRFNDFHHPCFWKSPQLVGGLPSEKYLSNWKNFFQFSQVKIKSLWNYKMDSCLGEKKISIDVWWFSVGFLPLRWICVQFIVDIQNSAPTVHSKVGFGRADMVNVELLWNVVKRKEKKLQSAGVSSRPWSKKWCYFTIKRTNEVRNLKRKKKSSRQNVGVSIN